MTPNLPPVVFDHQELLLDYANYEVIVDDMEAALQRFVAVYYSEILTLCKLSDTTNITQLKFDAAGAGASKFVYSLTLEVSDDQVSSPILGIRLYNSMDKMPDADAWYECAEEYRVDKEVFDQRLHQAILDETLLYHEFTEAAEAGVRIHNAWLRFQPKEANTALPLHYIDDNELKRWFVNLGLNAITLGEFIIGYDSRKLLERDNFELEERLHTVVETCRTLLDMWFFTRAMERGGEGRCIADLKPAQFVMQWPNMHRADRLPSVIIDVGPAENTDDITQCYRTLEYMRSLLPAFARQMLGHIKLDEEAHKQALHDVFDRLNRHVEVLKRQASAPDLPVLDELQRPFREQLNNGL
ncbi:MAG: hypothetical protein AAF512_24955 [Pseudomonadota bacterium]